jgi:hypothetical protein
MIDATNKRSRNDPVMFCMATCARLKRAGQKAGKGHHEINNPTESEKP